jgi:lactate permease
LIGLPVVTFVARRKWLLPADVWRFPAEESWPKEWHGVLETTNDVPGSGRPIPVWLAWIPYLVVAALLVLTRLPQLPFGAALKSFKLAWPNIFGTDVSAATTPFYLPATMLLMAVAVAFFLHRMPAAAMKQALRDSSRILLGAGFVLIFTVPMVRVYINTDVNALQLSSMPQALAEWVAAHVGVVWPAVSASIGALGAFIAGSNTVSNLMFSDFQYSVAQRLDISGALVVALQAVGAAAGNMIAIHNVVAASATVGLLGREGMTLRRTLLPTIYYVTVVGILGMIAIYWLNIPDPLG